MDTCVEMPPEVKSKTKKRTFQCEHCVIQFTFKNNLNRHVKKIHLGIKTKKELRKFQCDICYNNYSTHDYLKRHINIVHKNNQQVKCGHCETVLKSRTNLLLHLKYKHGFGSKLSREFVCDHCSRSFNKKTNLKYHIVNRICELNPSSAKGRDMVTCELCGVVMLKTSLRSHAPRCNTESVSNDKKGAKSEKKLSKRRKLINQYEKRKKENNNQCDNDLTVDTKDRIRASNRKRKEIDYSKLIDSFCEDPYHEDESITYKQEDAVDAIKMEPDVDIKVEDDYEYFDIPPAEEPNEEFEKVFRSSMAVPNTCSNQTFIKHENDADETGNNVFATSVSQYLFMMFD